MLKFGNCIIDTRYGNNSYSNQPIRGNGAIVLGEKVIVRPHHCIISRIIFDAPPLLATTEAQVLARLSGQVLLVVEAGRTGQHVVHEAISTLDARKAINLVLNKSQGRAGSNHYYQGTSAQQQLA